MFSKDFCKWAYVSGLYENAAILHLRMGKMLTRAEFMGHGVLIMLGPVDIADLAVAGKRFEFPQLQAPADPRSKGLVGLR